MARTKRSRRSYGAGEWGRNRVRIFPDPKTGIFQIEWRENGRRCARSLKHRDWARAKRQADQFAAGFIDAPDGKAEAEPEPLTLGALFGIYGEEVTPTKTQQSRRRDRATITPGSSKRSRPTSMLFGRTGVGRSPCPAATCPHGNASIPGASRTSWHLEGRAGDISVKSLAGVSSNWDGMTAAERQRVRQIWDDLDGIADGLNALDTQPFEEYADRHYHAAW